MELVILRRHLIILIFKYHLHVVSRSSKLMELVILRHVFILKTQDLGLKVSIPQYIYGHKIQYTSIEVKFV